MRKRCSLIGVALMLSLFSCSHDPVPFNEAQWLKDVEGQRAENLYAPHQEGGRFFNPWMPMEHGGFWNLLKWKLSTAGPYTDEEKIYLPNFIPGMKERILSMGNGDFLAW